MICFKWNIFEIKVDLTLPTLGFGLGSRANIYVNDELLFKTDPFSEPKGTIDGKLKIRDEEIPFEIKTRRSIFGVKVSIFLNEEKAHEQSYAFQKLNLPLAILNSAMILFLSVLSVLMIGYIIVPNDFMPDKVIKNPNQFPLDTALMYGKIYYLEDYSTLMTYEPSTGKTETIFKCDTSSEIVAISKDLSKIAMIYPGRHYLPPELKNSNDRYGVYLKEIGINKDIRKIYDFDDDEAFNYDFCFTPDSKKLVAKTEESSEQGLLKKIHIDVEIPENLDSNALSYSDSGSYISQTEYSTIIIDPDSNTIMESPLGIFPITAFIDDSTIYLHNPHNSELNNFVYIWHSNHDTIDTLNVEDDRKQFFVKDDLYITSVHNNNVYSSSNAKFYDEIKIFNSKGEFLWETFIDIENYFIEDISSNGRYVLVKPGTSSEKYRIYSANATMSEIPLDKNDKIICWI